MKLIRGAVQKAWFLTALNFLSLLSTSTTLPAYPESNPNPIYQSEVKILPSDGGERQYFGGSVSISNGILVVGANQNSENGFYAGAAYVFSPMGNSWIETQKITPSDATAVQRFGERVSIDGNIMAIAAPNDGPISTGAVYIFEREGSTWVEKQKIVADDLESADQFGRKIDLEGETLVVGVESKGEFGNDSGAAYVYVKNGEAWTLEQKLLPSDPGENEQFGAAVSISGKRIAIGAPGDIIDQINIGSAYIFEKEGSTWIEQAKLSPSDRGSPISFGEALSVEGTTVVIGANQAGGGAGAAYVFNGSGQEWDPTTKLVPGPESGRENFGSAISLERDRLLIGAVSAPGNAPFSGAIYYYGQESGRWVEQDRIVSSDGSEVGAFGISVDFDEPFLAVGANRDDELGTQAGAAYIYSIFDTCIQFRCKEPIETVLNGLDFEIQVYSETSDPSCCNPKDVTDATPIVNCRITSDLILESTVVSTCEDVIDLMALEIGRCFDQVSGVLDWRAVSGGGLLISSRDPFIVGLKSPEIADLGDGETLPLEECAVFNLGDGVSGNEFDSVFTSGIAVYGPGWEKRYYDTNQDCFIDVRDLLEYLGSGFPPIPDSTGTLGEFSTFWYE